MGGPAGVIVVKVLAVLRNRAATHHLVWRGERPGEDPATFHRPLGGHLEFGESTLDGVRREVHEETLTRLLDPRLLGVLESRFVHKGQSRHEIVYLYTGALEDPDVVGPNGGWLRDNDEPIRVDWRPLDDLDHPWPLYPDGLTDLFRSTGILGL